MSLMLESFGLSEFRDVTFYFCFQSGCGCSNETADAETSRDPHTHIQEYMPPRASPAAAGPDSANRRRTTGAPQAIPWFPIFAELGYSASPTSDMVPIPSD